MRLRRGIRLGRILGVEVTIDPSWFIFAAVIAWLLGQGFTTSGPRVSSAAGYLLGLMGAALFFVSVLAHELSHAVVAQRKGIPVPRITLFIFGGVAEISEEPHTAGDEVKIALAGPALSFCLGLVFLALGVAAALIHATAGQALFLTVGTTNILLGVFNLLPGFPLDGGRVLRAAIWQATGNFVKATRIAAISGRVIGVGMMAFGVTLTVFLGNPVNGIWLVFIGLFLHSAALGSYRQVTATTATPVVGQVMTQAPAWVPAYVPLDDALFQRLQATPDRALPVVGQEGWIAGIVTAESLMGVPRDRWPLMTVADAMVPMHGAMVAAPQEPLASVLARLPMNPSGRYIVLDTGRLVGLLTPAALGRSIHSANPAPSR